jgi:alpha-tubulin suppressor-like RCC1 family protein
MRDAFWISAVGFIAACAESVAPPQPYFIAMFPGGDTLLVGATRQFTATVYDYHAKPISRPVLWSSSDPTVAAVDSLGVVRAVGEGHARISAAAGAIVGSGDVWVTGLGVDRIWDFTQLLYGPQQVVCSDTGSFQFGQADPQTLAGHGQRIGTCTSDVRINLGVVADSVRAGQIIGDSITFHFATCTYRAHAIGVPLDSLDGTIWCPTGPDTTGVGVPYTGLWHAAHERAPAMVSIAPDTATIPLGLTLQLDAIVRDSAGRRLFWRPVGWSSQSSSVAAVSAGGLVRAVAAGSARITASVAPHSGAADVTVLVIDLASAISGWSHTCGTDIGGTAYCWGANANGQLGNGLSGGWSTRPIRVKTGIRFDTVVAGAYHSCGLSSGEAWCWGANFEGQLGDGTTTERIEPVRVAGRHAFMTLTSGDAHTCAIALDRTAYCWGRNDRGQLGDSSRTTRTVPTPVNGGLQFNMISAENLNTCGITIGGDLYCWGNNGEGEFGNGNHLDSDVPVRAGDTLRFAAISVGWGYGCGLTDQGVAYCWGDNYSGNLGIGTRADSFWTHPQPVTGAWTFRQLKAGGAVTCGVTTDAIALCWGYNARGSVGDSTTVQYRTVPTRVAGNHAFNTVENGVAATCGTDVQGTVWCWGANDVGQVGNDSTRDVRYPVKVGGQP